MGKANHEEERYDGDCRDCMNCIPIGDGDHICEAGEMFLVLDDYMPTEYFNWCKGRHCQPW